jgi:transposase
MPAARPPEFRWRAVDLVRLGGKPVTQIARDLGISYSCLRNWVRQADVDEGAKQGLSGDERAELVRLRRENRIQAMEIEILKRASALFARDHVLPKRSTGRSMSWPLTGFPSR